MFDLEGTDVAPDLVEALDVADATEEPTEADVAVLQMTEDAGDEALELVETDDEFAAIEKAA